MAASFDLSKFTPEGLADLGYDMTTDDLTDLHLIRWSASGLAYASGGDKIEILSGPFIGAESNRSSRAGRSLRH